mmetsp:Transcript_14305/g.25241  ORF Transcript_14305/g.25241 Transcript_14305/m.25241 type:complete len:119 (+) Transcript_14305:1581-1937(+)
MRHVPEAHPEKEADTEMAEREDVVSVVSFEDAGADSASLASADGVPGGHVDSADSAGAQGLLHRPVISGGEDESFSIGSGSSEEFVVEAGVTSGSAASLGEDEESLGHESVAGLDNDF